MLFSAEPSYLLWVIKEKDYYYILYLLFFKVWPTFLSNSETFGFLGGDYMIPVRQTEILPYFAVIQAVLQILHKLYLTITHKKFHPGKARSLFCNAEISVFRNKIFPCNCFSPPKWDEKVKRILIGKIHPQIKLKHLRKV